MYGKHRSQIKRWYTSSDMDLFVWFRNNVPVRFQLTHDKGRIEKAICWDSHRGFSHYLVDSGETFPDSYKQSPVLIGLCERQDIAAIAREFHSACEKIDTGVSDFIFAHLMELPAKPVQHGAVHTGHSLC